MLKKSQGILPKAIMPIHAHMQAIQDFFRHQMWNWKCLSVGYEFLWYEKSTYLNKYTGTNTFK